MESGGSSPTPAQSFLRALPRRLLTTRVRDRTMLFKELNDTLIEQTMDSKVDGE